jgi:hypothetical protein
LNDIDNIVSFKMMCCFCRDTRVQDSGDHVTRNSTLFMLVSEQIKKIETQYKKYVSGELDCTPQEGAMIINNYNSRRKLERML